jgi:radical SAM protein with 4Fe4S-binding SPASM domain
MKKEKNLEQLFDIWKERIEQLVREHPLHIISWEATRRCNLNCVHCGSPPEDVDVFDELNTDEIIAAFEQIANDFDMTRFRHINITGGEPFVRKDLLDILKDISKYPFYRNIDIQTNGIFIADNPEVLTELKKYGVTGLGVSIDGLEFTHDTFRRRKGSFEKAFETARLSVENGYVVTISVVAHSKNIDEIPKLFELTKKEIRPRVFRVMTIDPIGRAKFDSEYMLSPNQVKKVMEFLKNEYKKSCKTYAGPESTIIELGCGGWTGMEVEGTFRPFIFHCIAGINNLGILYDGKIASCSNISRDFIEGDLRKERIKDVWENKYHRYRNFEWKRIEDCVNCDQWDYCHGGPMHKRSVNGDMSSCIYKYLKK